MVPSRPARRIAIRILLGLVAAFGVCAALEMALILVDFRHEPIDGSIVVQVPNGSTDGGRMHVKDAATLWRPSPGAEIPWGDDERVNADGYRGPTLDLARRPDTLRIATLGDSSTFGHSVAYGECYSARVGAMLAQHTGRAVEVLDAGVIGYSVRQGLERWRALVRAYQPDIVVAAFGAVIEHVPAMGMPDGELIERGVMNSSAFGQWMNRMRRDLRLAQLLDYCADTLRGGRMQVERERWQGELLSRSRLDAVGAVDWLGTRRVSLDEFEHDLLELRDEVRASGARFVALSMPRRLHAENERPVLVEYSRRLADMARRGEIEVVDGRAAVGRALGPDSSPRDFLVDEYHPSPLGHEVLAKALVDALEKPAVR